jgi:dihydropteroate synthase
MLTGQKDTVIYKQTTLNAGGKIVDLSSPVVMGILNATPDSFYEKSRFATDKEVLGKAERMLAEGASLLDVGGYSTRPGAEEVSEEVELKRVVPIIKSIVQEFSQAVVSVDTFRAEVAKQALDAGASMVNDVSGGQLDERMYEAVANYKAAYVLMHMKGTPQNMASQHDYDNILVEMLDYFQERLFDIRSLGVADVLIDPGFGFAKNKEQNFFLLNKLSTFKLLGCPILAGLSRKSMVYKTLGLPPEEALNGTSVLHALALLNGAAILRVHDVKEANEAIKLIEEVKKRETIE